MCGQLQAAKRSHLGWLTDLSYYMPVFLGCGLAMIYAKYAFDVFGL